MSRLWKRPTPNCEMSSPSCVAEIRGRRSHRGAGGESAVTRTLPPPPPPPAPSAQGWSDGLLDRLAHADVSAPPAGGAPYTRLAVARRRTGLPAARQPPALGLGDGPSPSQHAAAGSSFLAPPAAVPAGPTGLIAAVLGLVLVADRWPRPWPRLRLRRGFPWLDLRVAAAPAALPRSPRIFGYWVVPMSRIWNEETNTFRHPAGRGCVYTLSAGQLCTHVLIVAPTGMGKTRSVLEPSLEYLDRIGAAGIYLDAKGDDFSGPAFEQDHPAGLPSALHPRRSRRELPSADLEWTDAL